MLAVNGVSSVLVLFSRSVSQCKQLPPPFHSSSSDVSSPDLVSGSFLSWFPCTSPNGLLFFANDSHTLKISTLVSCSSPKWIRGAVVSCYQWAITIGLLLAAIVNNATQNRDNHSAYRIPIAIQFVWAAILVSGMSYLPEVGLFDYLYTSATHNICFASHHAG
jgi:hypothetical protein